ncbi:hypothetical protein [Stutzerimonas stutzeri]|nr:hypothetical protein [Stutzerimonas stutzeri]MCQ4261524.1 hypothetical protein [Stutzerimonas stutzeri]
MNFSQQQGGKSRSIDKTSPGAAVVTGALAPIAKMNNAQMTERMLEG